MKKLAQRMLAEFTGTFFLVFFGCGAIIVEQQSQAITHLGIAIVFGLVVTVMIGATGHISMAHFNPAVTFAFALTGHFPKKDVLPFIISQLLGSLAACMSLFFIFEQPSSYGASVPSGSVLQSFVLEILITASLMFVIIAVATDKTAPGPIASILIGATVTLNALWAGPISGASMNPARSFGPALFQGEWTSHWIYWAAPIIGAALGAVLYETMRLDSRQR